MSARRRHVDRRRAVVVVAAVVAFALVVVGEAAPRLLGAIPFFRVRHVEFIGLRNLAPDPILGALRLDPVTSVFADLNLLADRVKGVPGVADAAVLRRYPGTLEIVVREIEPAAFVAGEHGRLVAVDGRGRILPIDPGRAALDLPIATRDSAVLGVLALVQSIEPEMYESVTTAHAVPQGGVALELGSRRLVFGRDAVPDDVRSVALVERDLARRGRSYGELDARFAGQVVVRQRHPRGGGGGGGGGGGA